MSTCLGNPNSPLHLRDSDDHQLIKYADFRILYEFCSHNHRNLAVAVWISKVDMLLCGFMIYRAAYPYCNINCLLFEEKTPLKGAPYLKSEGPP